MDVVQRAAEAYKRFTDQFYGYWPTQDVIYPHPALKWEDLDEGFRAAWIFMVSQIDKE